MYSKVYIYSALTILSLVFHILALSGAFILPNTVGVPLFMGMLIAWIVEIKSLRENESTALLFKDFFTTIPIIVKLIIILFALNVLYYFYLSFMATTNQGWVDTSVTRVKLLWSSSLWMLFYSVMAVIAKKRSTL